MQSDPWTLVRRLTTNTDLRACLLACLPASVWVALEQQTEQLLGTKALMMMPSSIALSFLSVFMCSDVYTFHQHSFAKYVNPDSM